VDGHPHTTASEARSYIDRGRVNGWLARSAATVITTLAEGSDYAGRPACEIGVHHGKLAILLGLLTGGRLVAYDLFEDQGQNVDGSGKGDRQIFLLNAAHHLGDGADVHALRENSLDLTPERVIADCGDRPALFSVDGGHTAALTANDLRLAAAATADDALVILDDFYNGDWPEVAFGAIEVLGDGRTPLVPFCTVGNKVLFAKSRAEAARFRAILDRTPVEALPDVTHVGTCEMLGHPVAVMRNWASRDSAPMRLLKNSALWRRIRHTSLGQSLRRLLLRVR